MAEQSMQASTFKAQCLHLIDEVAETRRSVVITKHGKPLARLVAYEPGRSDDGQRDASRRRRCGLLLDRRGMGCRR